MTVPGRFSRTLKGERTDRPPFWFMRQAGRYLPEYRTLRTRSRDFLDFCYSPELATEATLQPIRRFDPDAAILFSDILVVPDGLGQTVCFIEGEGPKLEPLADGEAVAGLSLDRLEARLSPVYKTVAEVKAALSPEKTLIGFAGAPWTVAVYMIEGRGGTDCARARRWAMSEPESFGRLIELLVEATVRHLDSQIENGADAVQLFDSWAGVLDAESFRTWSIEPTERIVRALRKRRPEVPVIGFPRLAGPAVATYAEKTGVAGIGLDPTIPMTWACKTIPPSVVIQGNLDPLRLVIGGDALERMTNRILNITANRLFIFNLGHGVVPETPPEHVELLADLVRNFRP